MTASHRHIARASLAVALAMTACAAGDPRFTPDDPAGFWLGLWHGLISFITLVVGLFVDTVEVYERDNSGPLYDLGFLLGVAIAWAGPRRANPARRRRARREQAQWEEIGRKVETKVRRMIREWADAEPDEDWRVVEAKAEAKLKRKLRAWAEEA